MAGRGGSWLTEGEIEVLSVFLYFLRRVEVYAGMCVGIRAHTGTHTRCIDGVLECEPSGQKRPLEGLKNPDGLNVGIYVFVYVYKADTAPAAAGVACPEGSGDSTHVYIYAKRREEILD